MLYIIFLMGTVLVVVLTPSGSSTIVVGSDFSFL